MARISKPGLDYFPLDVNFLQDRKVRRISCRHHAAGIAALTSLLCLIYKEKGYYILWNKDTLFDIAQEACCGEEEMQAIIDDCLSVGLFDDLIYKEYGVLTSQAIQEQYHKIITDSRRKYKLPLEHFWIIKEESSEIEPENTDDSGKDVTKPHEFATTMPQTKEETDTVTIKGIIKKEEVKNLEIGVDIGEYITKPAKVKILKTDEEKNISRLEITIHEGKNRQVRKMCEAIGHSVLALHRSKIAGIGVKDIPLRKMEIFK